MIPRVLVEMLLRNTPLVTLVIDRTAPGVVLPELPEESDFLSLEIGYSMPLPIPDLELRGDALRATLSFGRVPFAVTIPWGAVRAVTVEFNEGQGELLDPAEAPEAAPATGLRLVKD